MTKGLRDLEKRLQLEPDNLGLRITVASALREAGRQQEAVELYRSVAVAYRDQGRAQQAIAVCRSILEVAPDDMRCLALMAALSSPPERRSSLDETPLPGPLPYHVADPTTASIPRISRIDVARANAQSIDPLGIADPTTPRLPRVESSDLIAARKRSGEAIDPAVADADTRPESGFASAARRISQSLIAQGSNVYDDVDVAAELDTRQVPRIETADFAKIIAPPPTVPIERVEPDEPDDETLPPPGDAEEELTRPRDLIDSARDTSDPLHNAFFAPLPAEHHARLLARFRKVTVAANAVVIRRGESGSALVLLVRGELSVRGERADGSVAVVTTLAPGDFFGEIALLAHAPAGTDLVAKTDAELWLLPPRDFYELAGAFPALWARLKDIAERRRRAFAVRLEPKR